MRNIVLYYLPPHTTHVTQPVDVGLFGPLKAAFRKHEKATRKKVICIVLFHFPWALHQHRASASRAEGLLVAFASR
jgi:hypothetical protein